MFQRIGVAREKLSVSFCWMLELNLGPHRKRFYLWASQPGLSPFLFLNIVMLPLGPPKELKVPNIPGMMAGFVAGTVNAIVKVQDATGKEVACFKSAINLKT